MASRLGTELGKRDPFESPEQEAHLNLIRTAAELHGPFFALFKSHGLSEATYNVLRILRGVMRSDDPETAHKGVRSTEIGCSMVVRVPDVTRLVDRLVDKGLAKRDRCPEDRRVVYVSITKKGLTLLTKLDEPVRALHEQQLGHLDKRDLESLSTLLEKARTPPD